ncbi:gamma-glutamylcyclotransferase family protein [Sphingosinithalassobacter sp. LHW66-3]|uniref:gamma-glutamylcyclotransferase family protein n=1 Tax=Sphingosinithalassobacter sp. LHW66-3 TaxID=3424718 RepID=UPI003D6A05EF
MGRRARFVRIDWIRGQLFDFGDYPGALLGGRGWVHGEVFETRDPRLLADVDAVEDFHEGDPASSEYLRYRVTTRSGLTLWAYGYNRPLGTAPRIATGRWRRRR